ncbi:MAG: HEAT repeat domain-containing protein [Candidatus Bilamarchaeaceae archaeon]
MQMKKPEKESRDLMSLLKDKNPYTRMQAAKAFSQLKDISATKSIIEAYKDEDEKSIKLEMIRALSRILLEGRKTLMERMKDDDNEVATAATQELMRIGGPSAVTDLELEIVNFLNDVISRSEDSETKSIAINTLVELAYPSKKHSKSESK